jgi:hypothetical protein
VLELDDRARVAGRTRDPLDDVEQSSRKELVGLWILRETKQLEGERHRLFGGIALEVLEHRGRIGAIERPEHEAARRTRHVRTHEPAQVGAADARHTLRDGLRRWCRRIERAEHLRPCFEPLGQLEHRGLEDRVGMYPERRQGGLSCLP